MPRWDGWALRRASVLLGALCLLASGCLGGGGDDEQDRNRVEKPRSPAEVGPNAARVPGLSGSDVAGAAMLSIYPPGTGAPAGWVLVREDDWREQALAAQFAADPVRGGIMPIARDFIPPAAQDLLLRMRPSGFPRGEGLQTLVVGTVGDDVFADLQDVNLKLTQIRAGTAPELSKELLPFRGGWAKEFSDNLVVVSEERRDYALPAMAWSAYSGDTIIFVSRDEIPEASRQMLAERQKLLTRKPGIYVIGPPDVISESLSRQLAAYGPVTRIAGRDPIETAVELAKFHDPKTAFGWNLEPGEANVSLVNIQKWETVAGALNYAGTGPKAALLLTDNPDHLPRPVERYLRSLRTVQENQGFVFGDGNSIASSQLAEFNNLLAPRGRRSAAPRAVPQDGPRYAPR